MTLELFAGLFVMAGTAAYTPGPNNTLLMASGMNHGLRQTWPMILGVGLGFPLMIGLIGLGLGRVFETVPQLYAILKYCGALYMLYLAWKIATSRPGPENDANAARPLGFVQMCLFQWVNPKGWIMAITALSSYTLAAEYLQGVAIVVATFVFMGFTSATLWAGFGAALKRLMTDPRYFRIVNLVLAGLLVLSLIPMLRH
jgi:threonine/homoserine/homoserine lactone efflux protein